MGRVYRPVPLYYVNDRVFLMYFCAVRDSLVSLQPTVSVKAPKHFNGDVSLSLDLPGTRPRRIIDTYGLGRVCHPTAAVRGWQLTVIL
jgi:hypothetical protein